MEEEIEHRFTQMSSKGLLVAVILLALLGGGAYWYESRKKPESTTKEERLFAAKSEDIQQITVEPAGGEKITVQRDGEKWKITEPKAVPAEDSTISSMVGTLGGLNVSETIEEKPASLKDYGLDPPQVTVQLKTKNGATHRLLLGETTPTGSSVYAKTPDSPKVVALASHVKTDVTKTLFDLRDKTAMKVDTPSASHAWVQNKSGKFELVKSEDRWRILASGMPAGGARADQFPVNDLLRQAADARMQSVEADDGSQLAKFGLNAPEIVVRIQDQKGTHELKLSKEKDSKRYATSSDAPAIFTVTSTLAGDLSKAPADLRSKEVFDMDTWTANQLDVTTPEARVVLNKDASDWKAADPKKKVEQSAASDALEKLKAIKATSFPAAGPPSKFGLDKPVLRVTITWGEKKQKETVLVAQAGNKAYAQRESDPAIYEVGAEALAAAREAVNKLK